MISDLSDADGLAGRITAAFENSEKMGENARRKAKELPIEKSTDKIMKIISEYSN